MNALLAKLMTALLLFQAVTGWCCHRPCSDGAESVVAVHTAQHDCCHSSKHSGPQSPANSPCDCGDCLGFCTFVSERPAELKASELLSTVAALTAFVDCERFVESSLFESRFAGRDCAALSLRLHLLHQVLLV